MIIVVDVADRNDANQAAVSITGNDADAFTFDVSLSGTGLEPATHYGCSTTCTEAMRIVMENAESSIPSVKWWRASNPGGILKDSNVGSQNIGSNFDFNDAIGEIGLKKVRT